MFLFINNKKNYFIREREKNLCKLLIKKILIKRKKLHSLEL